MPITSIQLTNMPSLRIFLLSVVMAFFMVTSSIAADHVPVSVSKKIVNYHRQTPQIATSGKLLSGAVVELKAHGFKTILDIRTVKEGTAKEARAAASQDIAYHNLPVDKPWPESAVFAQFRSIVENKENYPLLIHCGSANRVGMMWSVYQLGNGVEYAQAVKEGVAIGMKPARIRQIEKNFGVK